MAASAAAVLDGVEATVTRTSLARPQTAATMALRVTATSWTVARAAAVLDGGATLARLTSLARLQTAMTMAPPLTRTNWMAALAVAMMVGVGPTAMPTSPARLMKTAVAMAQPMILIALMAVTARVSLAKLMATSLVTAAMLQ